MVRGRATGRAIRRGAAASAGGRVPAEVNEALDNTRMSNESKAATPATLDEAVASSASTTRVSTRRGGTAAGARATTAGRLKPKILRRDEADRDKLARQEEQKANERAAAERRARGRSRNRSKRSRGDAMGTRGGRGASTASGPFSGGFAGAGGSAGGGRFGGGSGVAAGGGFYGGRGKSESKGKGFAEADVRMREARINADRLHVIAPEEDLDSDDEAMMAALSGRTASTMPMGIYRREHKEQGVVVATTAELEAAEKATGEEESLWVDGEGPDTVPPLDQPEEGVWDIDGKPVSIKNEPDTEDPMDLDTVAQVAPSEEELRKPVLATKPKKELPKDPEERAIQIDLDLLAGELGAVTVTDKTGEARTEGPSDKDGRLYLFQFPPLIPPLKEVAQPQRRSKVKEEGNDFDIRDAPSATGSAVDLTHEDSNRNSNDDDEDEEDEQETEGFRSQFLSHGGMVGRLNVRKSGKVELDWGGMTLEMSPAAGMNFLTTAVIVEENDEKPQQGVVGGDSVGMGKVMGRFVLAPIWSEEEDWNVAPEEVVIAG
ncbi:hypothetical protein ED733_008534 [Metarhizium rileyi]|uniref:RNA polymerase III Rpc4 n=1 Tax=Metarhizium rileyi (strain RCEF 4871) TaxID=1649241 RepID=A0A5C6GLR0_METRR|nr:hypothetical protein ED733_008534 [Metarhizium rileyi]